jgi:hypothetical protein
LLLGFGENPFGASPFFNFTSGAPVATGAFALEAIFREDRSVE